MRGKPTVMGIVGGGAISNSRAENEGLVVSFEEGASATAQRLCEERVVETGSITAVVVVSVHG
jgi:hypothetical protein